MDKHNVIQTHNWTSMREEEIKIVFDILRNKFDFDQLDIIEFVLEYERKTGNKIPDNLVISTPNRISYE